MTPEEKQLLENLTKQVQTLTADNLVMQRLVDIFYRIHFIDKEVFPNDVYINAKLIMKDASSISLGATTGGKIGLTGEKAGFLGATPIIQQSAITAPSGGATVDSQARTAITSLINALKNFGFTA